MALDKTVLQAGIKAVFDRQAAKTKVSEDPALSRQEMAEDLADAIHKYLLMATVNTTVTGTATGGAVTGAGVGSLS